MPATDNSDSPNRLVLDHVFADTIGALRTALESALLERRAIEERFTTDMLLGDARWETSYSIPGEGDPPRVQADITLTWPTWSQASYRRWTLTGELSVVPTIETEIVIRAQGLDRPPDLAKVMTAIPDDSPNIGEDRLERVPGAALETVHDENLVPTGFAVEFAYVGNIGVRAEVLADGNRLDELFSAVGVWISGMLIGLGDTA